MGAFLYTTNSKHRQATDACTDTNMTPTCSTRGCRLVSQHPRRTARAGKLCAIRWAVALLADDGSEARVLFASLPDASNSALVSPDFLSGRQCLRAAFLCLSLEAQSELKLTSRVAVFACLRGDNRVCVRTRARLPWLS